MRKYGRVERPSDETKGKLPAKRQTRCADSRVRARLNAQLTTRPKDLDEHRVLFLFLYDVYTRLNGKDFADQHVEFEKKLKGRYDYETAWKWALAMSEAERASRFGEIVNKNKDERK
jgi:hypothetical protein